LWFGILKARFGRNTDLHRLVRFKRFSVVAVAVCFITAASAWLSFQHIPPWYRPLSLTRAQAETVREEAERTFELVSAKMVAKAPFSVSFSEKQINDTLSAQQVIWPAMLSSLGPLLTGPCVEIEPGHVRVGLRWRKGEVQTIVNNRLVPEEADGVLSLRSAGTRAGSLPIPASAIWSQLVGRPATRNAAGSAAQPDPRQVDSLSGALHRLVVAGEPMSLADVFYWPNGDIPFRISDVELQIDRVTISVLPLPH
jgi:hypothetical protein